jgi:RNA polymerase sigma-70 factor (ECF subfamily)
VLGSGVAVQDEHEQRLVSRAQRGDRAAFGQLVERYKRVVFAIGVNHLRNEDEAMDLVQDTFLKAFTKLDSFQADSNFKAWICRIAANGAIDRIRRNKTRRADELDERVGQHHLDEGKVPAIGAWGRTGPLEETELGALGRRLLAALDTLPETHRQCVLLCDVHGYSYQEIADELAIPRGTVMSRLFYARKKLQVLLEDYRDEASQA